MWLCRKQIVKPFTTYSNAIRSNDSQHRPTEMVQGLDKHFRYSGQKKNTGIIMIVYDIVLRLGTFRSGLMMVCLNNTDTAPVNKEWLIMLVINEIKSRHSFRENSGSGQESKISLESLWWSPWPGTQWQAQTLLKVFQRKKGLLNCCSSHALMVSIFSRKYLDNISGRGSRIVVGRVEASLNYKDI